MIKAVAELLNVLEGHVELAHLEYRYERAEARKRLTHFVLAILSFTSAFVFIQVALTSFLLRLGLPLWLICIGMAVVWTVVGALLYHQYGQRDPRLGEPFEGTQRELRKSLQWISKVFS